MPQGGITRNTYTVDRDMGTCSLDYDDESCTTAATFLPLVLREWFNITFSPFSTGKEKRHCDTFYSWQGFSLQYTQIISFVMISGARARGQMRKSEWMQGKDLQLLPQTNSKILKLSDLIFYCGGEISLAYWSESFPLRREIFSEVFRSCVTMWCAKREEKVPAAVTMMILQ